MAIPRASSRRFPILLTATLICVTSLPVFAQTPEQQPAPKVTEEMVVTARKREESPQEVPMSIVAPSEQQLRDRGAETIEDIAANVAGFTVAVRSASYGRSPASTYACSSRWSPQPYT